ncbi:MAG TPA: HIRAN domain-containing protein [Dissulfurispiraceae bacterium]|nr:HIRAN domain-containing protein [Dissulfurispiraceae bacterium]
MCKIDRKKEFASTNRGGPVIRREFLKALFVSPVMLAAPALAETQPSRAEILLLDSVIAGFQYYRGESVWARLTAGDSIRLVRESENRYDENAIEVFWKDEKLGYIPRSDNVMLAQMMDRRLKLQARISGLAVSSNPWKRIELQVLLDL